MFMYGKLFKHDLEGEGNVGVAIRGGDDMAEKDMHVRRSGVLESERRAIKITICALRVE